MARIQSISGQMVTPLDRGWRLAFGEASPGDENAGWLPAKVPGTVAQALENAGVSTPERLAGLDREHVWYALDLPAGAACRINFEGLAPRGDVYLGEKRLANTLTMFNEFSVDIPEREAKTTIYVHVKPLEVAPEGTSRRQRWRPHLIAGPHLRHAFTSLIGHMPGWCPDVPPTGLYRPVRLIEDGAVTASDARVKTRLEGTAGVVEISIEIKGIKEPPVVVCWDSAVALERGADGRWHGTLRIEKPPLWWPHTHGDPHLLPLTIHGPDLEGQAFEISLGNVGFRTVELDRGSDGNGFALVVNGVKIFCRGANWVPNLHLGADFADIEPGLRRMRDAGMNMVRVSGIMGVMGPNVVAIAEKLGILVHQDEPLANFDYDFGRLDELYGIERSVEQFLRAVEASPALAVVAGGSEMAQQAAMLSLPERVWSLDERGADLAARVHAIRPDVIVLPNSPYGGALPFQPDTGISHYFGVGAYCRPLEDARRARVRFATECLAFANLPQPERLAANAGDARPGTPEWKRLVVRDLKADWDFEDTRDFYLRLLYDVDPVALRESDPARYLALSAAVPGEVMEATFAEWRRVGSETAGGLVWFNRDIAPGFGWGVVDWQDVPKPPWFALKRAFQPVSVLMTDEGLNGLHCHVVNDSGRPRDLTLTLSAIGADGSVVIDGTRDLTLAPRSAVMLSSAEIFGIFFDVTYAYRFGPPAHVASVARLIDATGEFVAEAFHFPQGRGHAIGETGLTARLESDGKRQHMLVLTTQRLAQSIHIATPGFEPEDDWFHLASGEGRRIRLKGLGQPSGEVSALNGIERLRF